MPRALEIINRAYQILGVKATGETLGPDEIQDGMTALNDLIDSWRTEFLYVYVVQEVIHALTPNQQTVTIGPGAEIDVPVPLKLESVPFTRSSNIDYPMKVVLRPEYESIQMKTSGASYPTLVFYERNYPIGKLYFYPLPAGAYELHLFLQQQLTEFADQATEYIFPPGYRRALEYSLAEELSAGLREISPTAQRIAANARRALKRSNHITPVLNIEGLPRSGNRFNIFAGR
ncbi:hypothetical protein [Achromobacter anxifer]|uniref:hypothetical protein n=1 Tax=Achromobacter anxifer TaxID=1287737 RepID=UPI0023F74254|nr:hypothetical protein [Achromobacter anxifer]MDF8361933.1 hypothetical protein [Achromobacter anxifer]